METIRFTDVKFSYPLADRNALDGVSFAVEKSQFVVICGKSGCGKTTLLRHMKKNLMPYGQREGKVTYMGQEIEGLDDRVSAAEIGFVQQNPDSQIVTDKVWHELAFGLESLGLDNAVIKRRVAEMASYFDIQSWFRKDVSQLSGGQKQLLNLASIMAMQPKILVLDEPTSQLDPIAASEFLRTIYRINRELGVTIVLSEHRLEEAFTMADKVMVMDKGKIAAFDEPRVIGGILAGEGGGAAAGGSGGDAAMDNGDDGDSRAAGYHPMFYGLPAVTKIFHGAGGEGESPLTIREGRLWIDKLVAAAAKDADAASAASGDAVAVEAKSAAGAPLAIEAKDVWFRYDKKSMDVLRDLSFKVPKGALYCLLGGNGVGKSTTLKVLNGVVEKQRGKISIDGKLAMLPQNPQALFTEVMAEEELLEALHYEEGSDEEKVKKVRDMLDMMEISHLAQSHPYDLSGGEQQRLALGKVLLLSPDILLLDEPTKGLDPFFKITLSGILKKLTQKGVTIMMVSHDIEFCAEYADICAMFFDGGIVAEGEPKGFFRGNNFYTTTANRMAREHYPDGVTWEEVTDWVRTII